MEDVSKYIDLFAHLAADEENPWTETELEKLAGNNFLRVFAAAEQVNKCKLPNKCRHTHVTIITKTSGRVSPPTSNTQ